MPQNRPANDAGCTGDGDRHLCGVRAASDHHL
jgi:hypothetical protein